MAIGDRLARSPLPGVLRLGEPVDEDRDLGRRVREGGRDLLSGQADIASVCPHRHADGQRGQVGAQPVTSDRVQHGERQVASRLTSGRSAGGAKDRPGRSARRPCRQAGTPDRAISAARHAVMNKPGRRPRQPGRGKGPVGDDLVHPLDAGHQPGKHQAAQPAHRAKFHWCQRLPPLHTARRRSAPSIAPIAPRTAAGGKDAGPSTGSGAAAPLHGHGRVTAASDGVLAERNRPAGPGSLAGVGGGAVNAAVEQAQEFRVVVRALGNDPAARRGLPVHDCPVGVGLP